MQPSPTQSKNTDQLVAATCKSLPNLGKPLVAVICTGLFHLFRPPHVY